MERNDIVGGEEFQPYGMGDLVVEIDVLFEGFRLEIPVIDSLHRLILFKTEQYNNIMRKYIRLNVPLKIE